MKNRYLRKRIFIGIGVSLIALSILGATHRLSASSSAVVSFSSEVQQGERSEETEVLGLASGISTLVAETNFSSNSTKTQTSTPTPSTGESQPPIQEEGDVVSSATNDPEGETPEPDPNDSSPDSSAPENQTSTQQAANDSSDSDGNSTTPDEPSPDSENEPTATPSATPTPVPAPTLGIHRLGEYPEPIILEVGESFGVLEIDGMQIYLRGDGDVLERLAGPDSSIIFTGVKDGSVEIFQQGESAGGVIRTVLVGKTCYVHDGQTVWCDGLVQAE